MPFGNNCRPPRVGLLVRLGLIALISFGCDATERSFSELDAGVRRDDTPSSGPVTDSGGPVAENTGGGGGGGPDDRPNNGELINSPGTASPDDPNPNIGGNTQSGGGSGNEPSNGGGGTVNTGGSGGQAGDPPLEPFCGDGTADEGEECDPGDSPSSEAGRCNVDCELNACADGSMRACSEGGALGNCGLGMQLCDSGVWLACDVTPEAADSCDPGDDADCNGTPNEGCGCTAGTTQKCSVSSAMGNCAGGDQVCQDDGTFGPCSVQPAPSDSCAAPGDDADCDGTPNGGCNCTQEGEEQSCGPTTEAGICAFGVTTCQGGNWTACSGAVFPAARDCSSSADNDCDGSPDNTISGDCTCSAGNTRACEQHPGQDGYGNCEAGEQTCQVAGSGSSAFWGNCVGSVGPQPADSCSVLGDDGNCDGTANGGCNCVQGQLTTCAAEYGRQGDCGAYSLTCAADGRWPSENSSCTAATGDSCAPEGQCLGGVWDSASATFDDVCFQ